MKKARVIFVLICMIAILVHANSSIATQYEIIDLGTLGGWSWAENINNSGQIVGSSYLSGSSGANRAFIYENGTMTNLGSFGGDYSRGYGINDSGQIVGYSNYSGTSPTTSFLYQSGTMSDIGGRSAYYINNNGQVVGVSGSQAYLWDVSSGMQGLGTLGGNYSYAEEINDVGQIVGGSYYDRSDIYHAFLYENGGMIDLGTLGGSESFAYHINNNGQIVGSSYIDGSGFNSTHAFLYDNGQMIDLGTLGGSQSVARGINDKGQIVGWSTPYGSSERHAVLWNPISVVPEPISSILFLAGGSFLAGRCYMKRKRT